VTTISLDGRSRWNGTAWVPVGAAPPAAQFSRGTAREATGWTKPLQYAVAGWYALQGIYALSLPFVMAGPMADYFNQIVQRNAELNPNVAPFPPELHQAVTTAMTWGLAFGAVVGVALSAVAIVGALKRWTWLFYVVLVLLGLSTVSFPFTLISAFSTSALNPVKLPVALTATSIAFGFPAVALFAWMLVAAIKRGPWGMRRVG
jgi:hypothetical protein